MVNIFNREALDPQEEDTLNALKEALKDSVTRGNILKVEQIAQRFGQRPSEMLWPNASQQFKLEVDTLLFDLFVGPTLYPELL